MLESVRSLVALPRLPWMLSASVGSVVTFAWLLVHDQIHPLVIYLAQLYLSF